MTIGLSRVAGKAGLLGLAAMLPTTAVHAQVPSPGQVVPPTLQPAPDRPAERPAVTAPAPAPIDLPANAAALNVTLGSVRVEGGLPGLTAETNALTTPFAGRRVPVADVYMLARQIEAAYARHGYVLARVTVPPQQLRDGADVRLVVVDGFVEAIDASALPASVRAPVARRAGRLVGRRGLRIAEIERALLLAGETAGVTLSSTITPGKQDGGATLVLNGAHAPVSGSLAFDNRLGGEYGRRELVAQLSLNGVLGLGERIYGTLIFNPDDAPFGSGNPRSIAGGGIVLPVGGAGWQVNLEYVAARTNPILGGAAPAIGGRYDRAALSVAYPAIRNRRERLDFGFGVDAITESSEAKAFGTLLSRDRLRTAHVDASWRRALPGGATMGASGQLSVGIDGLGARSLADATASGVPLSRQGARPDFVKLSGGGDVRVPVGATWSLTGTLRYQASFSGALPGSQQFTQGTTDAVSTLPTGALPGDTGVTLRGELAERFDLGRLTLAPYVFAAGGISHLAQPTAVERRDTKAGAAGVGARVFAGPLLARTSLYAGAEYGGAFVAGRPDSDRFTIEIGLRF
ncbi:ShlB/FhaC/HecB family hemolysin secretion/activation protein [Sphingomonas immobilis]|uniref:POTRA domain-containing protein n=1 Tax=Sphingomonas immobilis TaxID=3063997 RepID=A0ABT9A052_9SPHN|nr:POTRA domain-containing protein [Sphingomonas sp. CA1-15]MDO7843206.1 POTRA domain-containing protein [Sphingomonas sp. CA1-15]